MDDKENIPLESKEESKKEIYKKPELDFFEEFGHIALIGPTNAGKTTKMKTFLVDENFRKIEMFVYCGQEKDLKEMAECFAAGNFLQKESYENKRMEFFDLNKIEEAIAFCLNKENSMSKLLFIDDALLQGSKSTKNISNFVSQAKNYNTTIVITMHSSTGDSLIKNIRSACRYMVFLNALPQDIKHILGISISDKLLLQYKNIFNKYEKMIIFDREKNILFNKDYKSLDI